MIGDGTIAEGHELGRRMLGELRHSTEPDRVFLRAILYTLNHPMLLQGLADVVGEALAMAARAGDSRKSK